MAWAILLPRSWIALAISTAPKLALAVSAFCVLARVRRRELFRAIEKLLDSCSAFQRELFKDSLNAQIHDGAARRLARSQR
jgi:hypothetical protein